MLMQLDADDTNEIEEISRIRSEKRLDEISSMAIKRTKGPLDLVFKKTKDTSLNDDCDKEARARTIQYTTRFVYTCGITFNVENAKAFKLMLEAVESYGPHLKPPSFHELRVPLLQKELEYTKGFLKNHKVQKNKYGCSIMSDGWTDRKDRDKLAELLDTFVEEMGEKNVIQLIIDNGRNHVAADKVLTSKRPNMFWNPCAAHCINLMLEDIRKIPKVDKVIKNGVKVVGYIYNHTYVLNLMSKFIDNVEFVKNEVTRLQELKSKLREMFTCDEWVSSKCAKDAKGKRATSIILMTLFWSDVMYTLKVMPPLVNVLRMVDNERKPTMGYIYVVMGIHSKKRNKLEHQRLQDLVFIMYNQTLIERFDIRDKTDPMEFGEVNYHTQWLVEYMGEIG
ncbi:uncharacterized protein LOC127104069 [Lathyrus oleraceus]|uniref:uncharacterized protein LOC127104069 n=1 Tax=Pisum sativum TaxID=3888 RepID=UPI0021CEA217|nr:uncharacterized protein LOC127104069 [Pisum sativum]